MTYDISIENNHMLGKLQNTPLVCSDIQILRVCISEVSGKAHTMTRMFDCVDLLTPLQHHLQVFKQMLNDPTYSKEGRIDNSDWEHLGWLGHLEH